MQRAGSAAAACCRRVAVSRPDTSPGRSARSTQSARPGRGRRLAGEQRPRNDTGDDGDNADGTRLYE